VGRVVDRVDRHGNRNLVRLRPVGEIVVHLGMSGRLALTAPSAAPESHTHFRMTFRDRPVEVRLHDPRRFGGVWLSVAEAVDLSTLGTDALGIPLREFRRALDRRRAIKALLLDQSIVAGLGNIYVDEALHRARIHPSRVADTLSDDEVRALHRAVKRVLDAALRFGGSTLRDYRRADGNAGAFQLLHRVYGRAGEPCLRCGTKIVRQVLAGRGTHTCPSCQRPQRSRKRRAARG
jgi:formamidopyrimidine-DNA glycosylase